MNEITFFCPGIPQSRGSKRAFAFKRKNGKLGVGVSDDNPKSQDWMASVAQAAHQAMNGTAPFSGPIALTISFTMPRRKGHFRTGKNSGKLKATAPVYHTTKPDATKLLRGVEDAMTGIVYVDDALIVVQWVVKQYGDIPGAHIAVSDLGGNGSAPGRGAPAEIGMDSAQEVGSAGGKQGASRQAD